jgi:transposase-like protein
MVRPGRDRLSGDVEVDETFVGGVEEGGGRRHVGKKVLVAVAVEIRGTAIGRVRLQRIRDSSAECLLPFVRDAVTPGSRVLTDGWPSYLGLTAAGYIHKRQVIRGNEEAADTPLPRVHRVASLLKRWLLGTHQGRPNERTCLITSTSSPFVSTVGPRAIGVCSSTGCYNRPSLRTRHLTGV